MAQLIADMQALRKRVEQARAGLHEQALTVLTPEQKAKLQALEEAAKLLPAARQAVGLSLLAPPANGDATAKRPGARLLRRAGGRPI